MPGPWTDHTICPNKIPAGSIVVRCRGCGSRHSTKNLGWRDEKTNVVTLARNLFDIFDETCKCTDKAEHPLVHDCAVDDIHFNWTTHKFEPGVGTTQRPDTSDLVLESLVLGPSSGIMCEREPIVMAEGSATFKFVEPCTYSRSLKS